MNHSTTTTAVDWQQRVNDDLEVLITRKHYDRDAAAVAAVEQETAKSTLSRDWEWKKIINDKFEAAKARKQRGRAAVATADEQEEMARQQAKLAADAEWERVHRRLRVMFPNVHHGLRAQRATWEAWYSVPNSTINKYIDQQVTWGVDGGSTTPEPAAPRATTPPPPSPQASAPQPQILAGICNCDFGYCNDFCSIGEEPALWWTAYPWLVEILNLPDPQGFVDAMPHSTSEEVCAWGLAARMLGEVRRGDWSYRKDSGVAVVA